MKATLRIQNFGPITNLDIEVKKFNILIGPQASGKSTISKVLCVIHSFDYTIFSKASEKRQIDILYVFLNYYRIENFHKLNTYWFFEDDFFSFELNGLKIQIIHKQGLEHTVNRTESYYIPAERIALPMISESLFELTLEQSTLPKYFLQFGKDFTLARKNQKTFNLPILNVEYEYKDGKNLVIIKGNDPLQLDETSSAIQANLPLLVILQYPIKTASLFVIEEVELHGFPTLQKELLYYITERMSMPHLSSAYVMLPTHSPYILSAANNLLFASKVAAQNNDADEKVNDIISSKSWIDKNDFSAYYVKNGSATSIVNANTGLIDENELDSISEDLAGEFDALMELYKPNTK
ncbi:AAA family ATPase [Chitinophaga sp. CF118]|uniref:AAA family ATPase n=1 Tax=Chitinophaga sp. CF118 TaxID=1884367 RepID=UPI000B7F9E90|nr:AAA family ATPase [Chitinophaga sp. CF118]